MKKNIYKGKWRLIKMDMWSQDYIDLVVPGYIEFMGNSIGSFQFGAVEGDIDYRIRFVENIERLEFSWEGYSEYDPCSGRGWAQLKNGMIEGEIYFHFGDMSGFVAEKME